MEIGFEDYRDFYDIKITGFDKNCSKNFFKNCSESDFEEYFSDYGEPIIIDIENGILSYESLEECIKNKEKMNGKKFKGKKISITILGKTINNSSKKIN